MGKTGLYKVTENDCDLIFNWRNEEEVIKNSFYEYPIEYSMHIEWFNNQVKNNNYFFIYYSDGIPIGVIRGEIDDEYVNDMLISYSIEKLYRGIGFGKKMIKLFEKEIDNKYNMIASVKKDNIASIKIFESLDYRKIEYNDYYDFIKRILY